MTRQRMQRSKRLPRKGIRAVENAAAENKATAEEAAEMAAVDKVAAND